MGSMAAVMLMAIDKTQIVSLVGDRLEDFKITAENFGKSRFMVYQSEYGKNEKEVDAMQAIAEGFRCEIQRVDNSFTLMFYFDENDPGGYLHIIDAGMPTPLLGGDRGTAHNPDGTTYLSKVDINLWGQPANRPEDLAKPASGVINEIKVMLADLFNQYFQDVLDLARNEIMQLVKQEAQERLSSVLGGGSK